MGVDASIPLDVNTQGIDVGKLMSMAQFAHQIRQEQRSEQTNNALRQIMLSPDAIDPKTSSITPNALKKIMQVDPETGIKLQGQELEQQMKMAQTKHYESENGKLSFDAMTGIAGAAYDAYDQAKKTGASEADARQAGIKVRNSGVQNNGGLISDADADKLVNSPFEPDQAKAFAGLNKEWSGAKSKEGEEDERGRHDKAMEDVAGRRVDATLANQAPTPGQDSEDALNYAAQVYREKGTLPTLGMGKAGAQFRMKVIQRAAEQAKAEGGGAAQDIGTQSAIKGDTSSLTNISRIADSAEAYENTALQNMKIVREKMPAGAVSIGPWLGKWVQSGRVGVGGADVPPYAAALTTVANEYAKVMSGSTGAQGSTVDSRKEAAEMLNSAQTPEQVNAVLDVMSRDMANKKESYKGQRDEIQKRIQGAGLGNAAAAPKKALPQVKASADYEKLKPGDHYLAPDGKEYIKK